MQFYGIINLEFKYFLGQIYGFHFNIGFNIGQKKQKMILNLT